MRILSHLLARGLPCYVIASGSCLPVTASNLRGERVLRCAAVTFYAEGFPCAVAGRTAQDPRPQGPQFLKTRMVAAYPEMARTRLSTTATLQQQNGTWSLLRHLLNC